MMSMVADQPEPQRLDAVRVERPMQGGGSASRLVACSDGKLYVVKTVGNPQGTKILANEFVSAYVGQLLGVPCPPWAQVRVTPECSSRTGLPAGVHFGSRYVVDEQGVSLNVLSPEIFARFVNLGDVPLVIAFDTLVANEDRKPEHVVYCRVQDAAVDPAIAGERYRFSVIDHGHCLGVLNPWSSLQVPQTPRQNALDTFARYVSGSNPFGPAFERLEAITEAQVRRCLSLMPGQEWGIADQEGDALVQYLLRQKAEVPALIRERKPVFPNWRE